MKRQEYIEWIRNVRGKMSQTEFGKKVYHYRITKNNRQCLTYHRNEIRNWESGKSFPQNIETFLSIALLEYDQTHSCEYKNSMERNERFYYVREIMKQILEMDLYCRNLHDALLIQVCRGILSFQEVLDMEPELQEKIQNLYLDTEEKREYALQRETENIRLDLYKINDKQDIEKVILANKVFFYTGNRAFGERFVKIYENRQRYPELLSLQEAVQIYAPNYRDSYSRIFFSDGMTRQWIIDLCLHLRFNWGETDKVLSNAHMLSLSDDEKHPDLSHFVFFNDISLEKKLMLLLLIATYVHQEVFEALPPVDYLLESFTIYSQGKKALKAIQNIADSVDPEEWDYHYLQNQLKVKVEEWMAYIRSGYENITESYMKKVFESYKLEQNAYYDMSIGARLKEIFREDVGKLHYMAALFYTVLTGKDYQGELSQQDLDSIHMDFEHLGTETLYIYRFLSHVLGTFLNNEPVSKDDKGGYYRHDSTGKKMKALDWDEIIEDLWASIIEFKCTK